MSVAKSTRNISEHSGGIEHLQTSKFDRKQLFDINSYYYHKRFCKSCAHACAVPRIAKTRPQETSHKLFICHFARGFLEIRTWFFGLAIKFEISRVVMNFLKRMNFEIPLNGSTKDFDTMFWPCRLLAEN